MPALCSPLSGPSRGQADRQARTPPACRFTAGYFTAGYRHVPSSIIDWVKLCLSATGHQTMVIPVPQSQARRQCSFRPDEILTLFNGGRRRVLFKINSTGAQGGRARHSGQPASGRIGQAGPPSRRVRLPVTFCYARGAKFGNFGRRLYRMLNVAAFTMK